MSLAGVAVATHGEVLDSSREYVLRQLERFARRVPERLESMRVRLGALQRRNLPWSALVQTNLEVDGHPVRAQVAGAFFTEAGRLLRSRLTEQIARLRSPDTGRPWPPPGGPRLLPAPGATVPRRIVRTKSYALARCAPDQAALFMDVMDYDFHLFVDADSGQDSVIYRVGPTGYRLARLIGVAPPAAPTRVPLTINVYPVPWLTPTQAVARLDETEMPFQFFGDGRTGRGAVLYRRFDGQYGLITAAGAAEADSAL
ncbi:sigma 54 modulation/S30EA ribosomal C-terminal domain-containing protein [Pseudonocardia hispaniensis]|uniref:Sigma 54 modulation/S30EA ribosomal C-terminal domain-containing protein n=1 Tax=Pseudonocardia hispaniensis TaxID=904933 RepID=A0ABW1J4N1_9PSEU